MTTRTDSPTTTARRRVRDVFAALAMLLGSVVLFAAATVIDLRLTALLGGLYIFAVGAVLAVDDSDAT